MRKTEVNMLSGSITKGLISMAIPVMIMNVFQTIANLIDMTVLGNLVDDAAVGAVGVCGVLISVSTCLLVGIASGANVVIARYIGQGNVKKAEEAVGTAVLFGIIGGFVLGVLGFCFADKLLLLNNCPETLMDQAALYLRLYFCGSPFLMLYNFSASALRARGDTKSPMYFILIGGIVKIILNYTFIIVFNTTVDGVAIATLLCNLIAAGLCVKVLAKKDSKITLKFENLKIRFEELKKMLFIGIPTGLQSALYSAANILISATVNSYGAKATTGISIANQFDGILYNICIAASFATMPYVSQNLGAGNVERVKDTVKKSILVAIAMGASMGALSAIFSKELSMLMTSDPEVIAYAQEKMIIVSSTYFICGINEIMSATMRGLGRPFISTATTLIFMCALRFVWVYLLFPLLPNFTFLYLVWPIGWLLSIITILAFYFPTIAKIKKGLCVKE